MIWRWLGYVLVAILGITAGIMAVWLLTVYGFIAWACWKVWKERSA